MLHAPPISWMSKTHREASHYAVFSSLLFPQISPQRHIAEHPQPISFPSLDTQLVTLTPNSVCFDL